MDDLMLIIGSTAISGWTKVRVTRGIERFPSSFELELTERYDAAAQATVCSPGDPCQVMLGGDVVVTGYVDRMTPSISSNSHTISVIGRGKCADLVDCAAEWPGNQILGNNVLQMAQKFCEVYPGLSAIGVGDMGGPLPQFNLIEGETAYEVIERMCRFRALLVYEQPTGNLILTGVGTEKAASGFQQGVNVEAASIAYSMDQRYSEYVAFSQSFDMLSDVGEGGFLLGKIADPAVTRHRRHVIIAETPGQQGQDIALKRAQWECNRRAGRSNQLHLRTDAWRDANGQLYEPNSLVPLTLPVLKIINQTWLISEVAYTRDESGTHCELVIMPPQAFSVQPALLQPQFGDVPVLNQPNGGSQ